MTTEKIEMIEAYLNAKTGDEDKDVDQTLVHRWKPFTDEDIREVADMLTENDIRRYVVGKYVYLEDIPTDFLREFDIEIKDQFGQHQYGMFRTLKEEQDYKDQEIISNLYIKLWDFLQENTLDEATWTKYFNWYNKFGFELSYEECVKDKQLWDVFANLEATPIPLHKIDKAHRADMDMYWRRQHHERMNQWFEQNVEGYKEFEA